LPPQLSACVSLSSFRIFCQKCKNRFAKYLFRELREFVQLGEMRFKIALKTQKDLSYPSTISKGVVSTPLSQPTIVDGYWQMIVISSDDILVTALRQRRGNIMLNYTYIDDIVVREAINRGERPGRERHFERVGRTHLCHR
jgi:hypothetical protein